MPAGNLRHRALAAAAVVGAGHAAYVLWAIASTAGVAAPAPGPPLLLWAWTAAGAFLLGATPAYLFVRWGLVLPLVAAVVAFTLAAAGGPVLVAYAVGWFLPFTAVAGLGAFEYVVRAKSG